MTGLCFVLAALATGASTPDLQVRRAAVVVGASAPMAGRPLLRHAHRDAETMAEVLLSVGGFDRAHVHVLRDPEPAALLGVVEREASRLARVPEGMLFFYYSGHVGDGALFTAGKPLAIDALRLALDRPEVAVRIGVLDACHGGAWTRAKGLVPDEPFEVAFPPLLSAEGSAFIASSSGLESAHESDLLAGSFFTHHLAAALRGAADTARRGEVTLAEAFEYAREQTVRETALISREPQHPSFALNLKGRQDVVLAQPAKGASALAVEQTTGPLEILHLGSGLRMVELPPGGRSVLLTVPPGRYLVRKIEADGVRAREITVPRDGEVRVEEGDLVLGGSERVAMKGERSGGTAALPRQWGADLELSYGLSSGGTNEGFSGLAVGRSDASSMDKVARLDGRLGLTDRLAWRIGSLAFAYRFGEAGHPEIVPYAGMLAWSRDIRSGEMTTSVGGGVAASFPLGLAALLGAVGVERTFVNGADRVETSVANATIGCTLNVGTRLSIHLGAGLASTWYPGNPGPSASARVMTWRLGSVQELGLSALPLLALHLGDWSLDLYAARYGREASASHDEVRAGLRKRF